MLWLSRENRERPGMFSVRLQLRYGASDGPVSGTSGRVFGINSTGFDGTDDFYVSRIDELLSLEITTGEGESNRINIQRLIDEGAVTLDP